MELIKFKDIHKKHIALMVLVAILVGGNIFFVTTAILQWQEVQKIQKELDAQRTNKKVVIFLNLFVKKVLKSDKEISFEDRLALENAIRDINDPKILAKWEQFTGGIDEFQIQTGVKELLEALVSKIYY